MSRLSDTAHADMTTLQWALIVLWLLIFIGLMLRRSGRWPRS